MEAYQKAIELLRATSGPDGFIAAQDSDDNYYKSIWAIGHALCGLAALSAEDEALVQTFRKGLEAFFTQQDQRGFMPPQLRTEGEKQEGWSFFGRVDSHAWAIISACTYAHIRNDKEWIGAYEGKIASIFSLMDAWEFNGRGLVYVPAGADWADEYYHHGYILYDQLLRLWALRCAAKVFDHARYREEAVRVQSAIEKYFSGREFYSPQVERMWQGMKFPYWVMGFNATSLYMQFDLQANALAFLLNIHRGERPENLVDFINDFIGQQPLLPSFYPVIAGGDRAMQDLRNNHTHRFRNLPYEFHNGGCWPAWNGLAALCFSRVSPALAKNIRMNMAELCREDGWQFNECYHGETGEPIGVKQCSWSAAGRVLATNTEFIEKLIV
jgi:hypothetical protein